jgi:hypothetical protein
MFGCFYLLPVFSSKQNAQGLRAVVAAGGSDGTCQSFQGGADALPAPNPVSHAVLVKAVYRLNLRPRFVSQAKVSGASDK